MGDMRITDIPEEPRDWHSVMQFTWDGDNSASASYVRRDDRVWLSMGGHDAAFLERDGDGWIASEPNDVAMRDVLRGDLHTVMHHALSAWGRH